MDKPENPNRISDIAKFITNSDVHIISLQEVGSNMNVGEKYKETCTDCNQGLDFLLESMQEKITSRYSGYKKSSLPHLKYKYAYEQHTGFCLGEKHKARYNHNNAIIYKDRYIKPLGDDAFEHKIDKYCNLLGGELINPCLIKLSNTCRHAIVFPFKFNENGIARTMVHINVHLSSNRPMVSWQQLSEVLQFVKSQPTLDFAIAGDLNMHFDRPLDGRLSTMLDRILTTSSEVVNLLNDRKMLIPYLRECYTAVEQISDRRRECESLDHIWFIMKKDTNEQLELSPVDFVRTPFNKYMNRRYEGKVSDHAYLFTYIILRPEPSVGNRGVLLDDDLPLADDLDDMSFGNQPNPRKKTKTSIFDDFPNLLE